MIFLTGDTHIPIDIKKLNARNFPQQKELTRDDYVIVLGDFGLLWQKNNTYRYWLDILSQKKFTLLWLDGNHENHEWIDSLPVETWNGGKVHRITDNILHLMRGQVFTIDGKKFFVCGGALSVDKEMRTEGISWWAREQVSYAEMEESFRNLELNDNHVDYILTHTCPDELITPMFHTADMYHDPTGKFLTEIHRRTDYKHWYFGHWHEDKDYGRFTCLYDAIRQL